MEEFMFLGLRLMEGVSGTEFFSRFGQNMWNVYGTVIERLEKQGRLEEFLNQPVQLRDYSKVNFKFVNDYVKSIR